MRISPNDSLTPCIYHGHRNMPRVPETTAKGQPVVFKRSYPFQRLYLHTSLVETDTTIYNIANKAKPLTKNPVGMFVDIYA